MERTEIVEGRKTYTDIDEAIADYRKILADGNWYSCMHCEAAPGLIAIGVAKDRDTAVRLAENG